MTGLQRTLILSLLLHITLSALFLLSVRLQGDGGKMLNEKVFFVDLKSDAERPLASVVKDASLKKTVVKKMEKEPAVIVEKREDDKLKDPVSGDKETGLTEPLSAVTPVLTKAPDRTFLSGSMGYADSEGGGEEIIVSTITADDKSGWLSKADTIRLISAAIERAKIYPAIARRRGIEGTVYVSFLIGAEGEPREIKVIKSSGYKMLDETTMKVIMKAPPYPYIDNRVEVPVIYRLND
jgi:TonB family protein